MKAFMITWLALLNGKWFDRQILLNALDATPEILNWRASVGAVFVVSASPINVLADRIRQKVPGLHFVITPVDIKQIQGWADKETWDFISRPRHAGMP